MTAYIVARVKVVDPNQLKNYMAAVPPIVEKYHGKFIARGGPTMTFEGPIESRRMVIIEFPALSNAEAFYHSEEYTAVRKLRDGAAIAEFIAVEGLT